MTNIEIARITPGDVAITNAKSPCDIGDSEQGPDCYRVVATWLFCYLAYIMWLYDMGQGFKEASRTWDILCKLSQNIEVLSNTFLNCLEHLEFPRTFSDLLETF